MSTIDKQKLIDRLARILTSASGIYNELGLGKPRDSVRSSVDEHMELLTLLIGEIEDGELEE